MTTANLQLILSENYSTCRYIDVFLMCPWWESWWHTLPSLSPLWVKDFCLFISFILLFWIYHASPSSLQSFCLNISKVLWDSLICNPVALIFYFFSDSFFIFIFSILTIMFLGVTSLDWSCLGFSVLPGLGCLFLPQVREFFSCYFFE